MFSIGGHSNGAIVDLIASSACICCTCGIKELLGLLLTSSCLEALRKLGLHFTNWPYLFTQKHYPTALGETLVFRFLIKKLFLKTFPINFIVNFFYLAYNNATYIKQKRMPQAKKHPYVVCGYRTHQLAYMTIFIVCILISVGGKRCD